VASALARALRALDRQDEAIAAARTAVDASVSATDWHVPASARWLLTELEAEAGVPGAASGRDYGRLLSQVLWEQRLSTLQGARSAVDVERLRRDHGVAVRAAAQDPLTGLGNRRALDGALRALATHPAVETGASDRGDRDAAGHCLLLLDLDGFKAVNDVHGHLVGDEVLRAVGAALQGAARSSDLVVRLGGDEFVVLAPGSSAQHGKDLAGRLLAALDSLDGDALAPGLQVRGSVGVASTADGTPVAELLRTADAQMYRMKRAAHD
jgi:diguanylate cyclase (GGDEF)-like protein